MVRLLFDSHLLQLHQTEGLELGRYTDHLTWPEPRGLQIGVHRRDQGSECCDAVQAFGNGSQRVVLADGVEAYSSCIVAAAFPPSPIIIPRLLGRSRRCRLK